MRTTFLLILLALCSATPESLRADTRLIRGLDVRDVWQYNYNISHWLEQGNLQAGCSLYGEESVAIRSLSPEMRGADWIQPAYGSKNFTGALIASFVLKHDADVYIAHADAIGVKPQWLKPYAPTPYSLTDERGERFSFYRRRLSAGTTVELGPNGDTRHSMYVTAVLPVGEWPHWEKPDGNIYDVKAFGAVGDGETLNTEAIQSAVDRCSVSGGGTVYLEGGTFLTGTLVLKDNVTLHVAAGTILRGSADKADYPPMECALPSFRQGEHFQLIYAENAWNVTITGGGIIDGYSLFEGWPWKGRNNEHERPRLIRMVTCRNIVIRDITLIRSANWTQYYEGCEDLTAENVTIRCYTGTHNQDGFDISGCRRVSIRNVLASCGDDVICIKALSMLPGEDIRIDGVRSRYANCNLIKIGTETHGAVRNLHASNLEGHARYGIAVECVDGATVENIIYENITLYSCAAPMEVRLGNRGRTFPGGPQKAPVGIMRNITFRNVRNLDIGYVEDKGGPGVGAPIGGIPGQAIENITIENCDFLFYGTVHNPNFVYREVPENAEKYPGFNIYGTCPAYGLYFRHVKGATVRNVTIRLKNRDVRPAIVLDDVSDYHLTGVTVESGSGTVPHPIWHKADGEIRSE